MSIIEDPLFRRWIPAQEIMDRWGMEYISFRQLHPPLYACIQTKPYDYSLSNPMVKNKEGKCTHFRGIETVPYPYIKEDFELIFYDFFLIAQFEHHHPEIVKNREVSPYLEKDFAVHHPAGNIEHKLPPEQDPPPPCQEQKTLDYSNKTRSVKRTLRDAWRAEIPQKTWREIAELLFKDELHKIDNGEIKMEALTKRVKRL